MFHQSSSSNGITAISPSPLSITGSERHHLQQSQSQASHPRLIHSNQHHDGLFTSTMPSTSTLLSNSSAHHHHHLLGGSGGAIPVAGLGSIGGIGGIGVGGTGAIGASGGLGASIGSSTNIGGLVSGIGGPVLDRTLSTCRGSATLSDSSSSLLSDNDFPLLARNTAEPFPTTSYHPPPPSSLSHVTSNSHIYTKDVISALQQRAPYANLIRSDTSSFNPSTVEFHIQNEDFPALPGANAGSSHAEGVAGGGNFNAGSITGNITGNINAGNMHQSLHQQQLQSQLPIAGPGPVDGVAVDARFSERLKSGIQTHSDGRVTGIPAGMLNDQFGMAGLLTFLRAIENDPNIVALALGHDLTTLGLNLNAPDKNLYATFGGPWADFPCRTQDLDTKAPDEYLTNATIREKLPNIKLNKLAEDVLFYLFYNCPGEIYQMAAAYELYTRDWRFHKTECVWLTRSQFGAPKEQTGLYEKGMYNVFDPTQWRKIPKEMTLEYTQLEERPKLPAQLAQ
jgi:CCR4-NOT transcription complex subunit 2